MDRAASEVIRQAIALIPRTTQECRELAETAGRLHSEGRIGLYKGGDARDNAYTHGGKGGNIDVNVAEIDTDSTRVRELSKTITHETYHHLNHAANEQPAFDAAQRCDPVNPARESAP